jgi:hypothetical protein
MYIQNELSFAVMQDYPTKPWSIAITGRNCAIHGVVPVTILAQQKTGYQRVHISFFKTPIDGQMENKIRHWR